MKFATPLVPARLIKRYKRFLADAVLDSGECVTAHCANPGAMTGLAEPGCKIWLEPNDDPRKKLRFGWRMTDHENGHCTGVDTSLPNRIVGAALAQNGIAGLAGRNFRAEVAYGTGSRVDFVVQDDAGETWLEVKSVTLSRRPGLAEFPDSVTARGARHMRELAAMAKSGDRAALLFVVQRSDCVAVSVAADIDPAYAQAMTEAVAAGVTILAMDCDVSPAGITLRRPLPVISPAAKF